jgi:hypothetical protein
LSFRDLNPRWDGDIATFGAQNRRLLFFERRSRAPRAEKSHYEPL